MGIESVSLFGGSHTQSANANTTAPKKSFADMRKDYLKKTPLFNVNPNVFQPAAARD